MKTRASAVSSRLLGLVLLGITLVFVGIAVLIVASMVLGGSGSVGGIILIGPIPIVFGAGPEAVWLIANQRNFICDKYSFIYGYE